MYSPELIARWVGDFATSVEGQNRALQRNDAATGNKYAKKYIAAVRKLREAGSAGWEALALLLADSRIDVRTMAACFLLRYNPERAQAVLKESALQKGVVGLGALMTLKRWEDGSWNLDQL